jgi:hypothetical protein
MSDSYTFDHHDASHVLIRCASHRARHALNRYLQAHNVPIKSYYSWDTACTGGFVRVPFELFPEAVRIKGCNRVRPRYQFHPCLNWSNCATSEFGSSLS